MYSRIVVGTDGTDRSLIAVDHAARLAAAPRGFTHRDYQSRNLMMTNGDLVVIGTERPAE